MADSYDGYDVKAAEQLRLDQCTAVDAIRKGGPNLSALGRNAIALPANQLHEALGWDPFDGDSPIHRAFDADDDANSAWLKKINDTSYDISSSVTGLDDYPGAPEGGDETFDRIGLLPWLYQSFLKPADMLSLFYDPSPQADRKTKDAAVAVGDALYASGGTSQEQAAWKLWKKNSGEIEPNKLFVPRVFADDARIFLASGGFPRTAAATGTPEFRIAVEDLKARFASCNWHDPIDPNRVLGKEVAAASAEWQQEMASQADQRQQILDAGATASKALQDGTFALGQLLGQAWVADYITRWKDYWTEGGLGWIGDADLVIEAAADSGQCLDVQGGRRNNGTPVQLHACNGSAAQKWRLYHHGGGFALSNVNSQKCLDVGDGGSANGNKVQIWSCDSAKAPQWAFDVRAVTALRNVDTGKCLNFGALAGGQLAELYTCNKTQGQHLRIVPQGHTGTAPSADQLFGANRRLIKARTKATVHFVALKNQLETAKEAAATSDTAVQAAYAIADSNGTPRGRGLIAGQQKAQVTKGTVAALEAMVKAGETAQAAARASAADSEAITQRARAQAAQVRAEFRREAAEEAERQAKAARDAAKLHRDNAQRDAATAKAKLNDALKAEADAKAAAADAHAKRLAAEAEEQTARAEKETAAARQAEANQHKQNAQAQAAKANDARAKAEAAEKTAAEKRDSAVKARDHAQAMRNDAWDAEQKANAARAKADAKQAYADSLDAGEAADAARTAATDADKHATDAENAAVTARSEADAATRAAAEADAAATRAEAAAKRARADADAANAAKLRADAAVATATSAAADAITASEHAAWEATVAVKLADEAEQHAKDAQTQADGANAEAGKARAAAAKAAGFAYSTAQAAADASTAAAQVAKPANDAIEIGAPYVDTDAVAGLVVLTGQGSKTVAEQQQAVAQAHAANAKAEAEAAQHLADQAAGDAKQAYVHAATAASYAATARQYAKEALAYSAEAAGYAAQAATSLARAVEYDRQAAADAAAADKAAGRAEGYAKDARASADQAALDAEAARTAASQAEQAAKDARAAADRAATLATEAEQAAKDADKYAEQAQEAYESALKKEANRQVATGGATGVGGVFYVLDEDTAEMVNGKQIGTCPSNAVIVGCDARYEFILDVTADFYLCSDVAALATAEGCPKAAWTYLTTERIRTDPFEWDHHFTGQDIIKAGWQAFFGDKLGAVLFEIVLGDVFACWHGSKKACAWTAAMFLPLEKPLGALADAVKALDAAARTGIGFEDAWKGLRALSLSDEALAGIGTKALSDLEEACAKGSIRTAAFSVRVAASGARVCPNWAQLGGPGRWRWEREAMKSDAPEFLYQYEVTGKVPYGFVYKVPAKTPSGYVKFDGFQNGTLIDAKYQGFGKIIDDSTGKFKPFVTKPINEMKKQVEAAGGIPVVWYVATQRGATALQHAVADHGIKGIKIVYRPASWQ
ncbi:RICIN domain-containing protein [Streptomyces sp. bgisy153]|uniref:RICIN domain-containing protein n=1 Tax=Streptomyces sp. bgisy153 TaxID=3413793 RepID=UPI003D7538C9